MKDRSGSFCLDFIGEAEVKKVAETCYPEFPWIGIMYGDLYLLSKGYNASCIDLVKCKPVPGYEPMVNVLYGTDDGAEYVMSVEVSEFVKTLSNKWVKYSYEIKES